MQRTNLLVLLVTFSVALVAAEVLIVSDPKCSFTTFSVGLRDKGVFKELYRTCYDMANLAAKYTQHKVYPSSGAACAGATSWRASGTVTGITGKQAESFSNENIRSKTHAGFPQYDRGHLAACADFASAEERSATFEIINAVPQVHTLNNGRWKRMEKFIRSSATPQGVDVVTGGLGVLQYNRNPIYLWASTGNPITEFTYKVARVKSATTDTLYAFVAYNAEGTVDSQRLQAVCQQVTCQRADLIPIVVCCEPATFIRKNLPNFKTYFNV